MFSPGIYNEFRNVREMLNKYYLNPLDFSQLNTVDLVYKNLMIFSRLQLD